MVAVIKNVAHLLPRNQFARANSLLPYMLFVILALFVTGCKQPTTAIAAASAAPPEVGVASVISKQVRLSDEFNGRVAAIDSVDIRARVTGYVDRVNYREGDEVKRGDLLFVIDPRPYEDALASAKAVLERARAAAAFAQIQEQRAQTLDKSKAISKEEFQNRTADLTQSNANVHEAEAAVAAAELNIEFTEVRAPVDGRTSRARLTAGNLAQADQSVLTTVVSQDPVYVYFDCDEQSYLRYQNRARKGERVSSANPVRIGLANETGFPHIGKIDFLDNEVNAPTGTIRVRVRLANPDRLFTPGLYARVQLESNATMQALLIDDKAVLTDQDRRYVYVVDSSNKAQRKDVALGAMAGGLRVVRSGLSTGDRIIVSGLQKIYFPGAPVTPKEAATDPAALQASAR